HAAPSVVSEGGGLELRPVRGNGPSQYPPPSTGGRRTSAMAPSLTPPPGVSFATEDLPQRRLDVRGLGPQLQQRLRGRPADDLLGRLVRERQRQRVAAARLVLVGDRASLAHSSPSFSSSSSAPSSRSASACWSASYAACSAASSSGSLSAAWRAFSAASCAFSARASARAAARRALSASAFALL